MTLAQIRARVRDLLQEETENAWDDADLDNWINDGFRDAAARTLCIETSAYKTVDAGVGEYDLPANVVDLPSDPKIRMVTFDGRRLPRRELDEELSARGSSWEESTGQPECYYLWAGRIGLLPIPSEAKVLRIWYAKVPQPMASDDVECTLPSWAQAGLVDYAAWRAFSKIGDERAAAHREAYDRLVESLGRSVETGGMDAPHVRADATGWS